MILGLCLAIYQVNGAATLRQRVVNKADGSVNVTVTPLMVDCLVFRKAPLRSVIAGRFVVPLVVLVLVVLVVALLINGARVPSVSGMHRTPKRGFSGDM